MSHKLVLNRKASIGHIFHNIVSSSVIFVARALLLGKVISALIGPYLYGLLYRYISVWSRRV